MTHLSEDDLLKWGTFEKMRAELAQMNLQFRLERFPR
jgi:hypothetical protein